MWNVTRAQISCTICLPIQSELSEHETSECTNVTIVIRFDVFQLCVHFRFSFHFHFEEDLIIHHKKKEKNENQSKYMKQLKCCANMKTKQILQHLHWRAITRCGIVLRMVAYIGVVYSGFSTYQVWFVLWMNWLHTHHMFTWNECFVFSACQCLQRHHHSWPRS